MSRVKQAVQAAIEAQRDDRPDYTKKITLRMGPVEFYKLHKLAEVMGLSKTGCAEDLLTDALEDGWEAAGLVWDEEDAGEFFAKHTAEAEQRAYQERMVREIQAQTLVEGQVA